MFKAFGPSFKKNQTLSAFENVNVHPLMCKLLDLDSKQSNGSDKIFEPYLVVSGSYSVHLSEKTTWIPIISFLIQSILCKLA